MHRSVQLLHWAILTQPSLQKETHRQAQPRLPKQPQIDCEFVDPPAIVFLFFYDGVIQYVVFG